MRNAQTSSTGRSVDGLSLLSKNELLEFDMLIFFCASAELVISNHISANLGGACAAGLRREGGGRREGCDLRLLATLHKLVLGYSHAKFGERCLTAQDFEISTPISCLIFPK